VVDRLEEPAVLDVGRRHDRVGGDVPGQVGAVVPGALHQGVQGLAVGGDGGEHDLAVLVLDDVRLPGASGAPCARVPAGRRGLPHLEGEVADAGAGLGPVPGEGGAGPYGAAQVEARGSGRKDVGDRVPAAGLRAAVGDEAHAEGGGVE